MKFKFSFLLAVLFVFSACQKDDMNISSVDTIAKRNADTPLPALTNADNSLVAVYIHWGDDIDQPVVGANVFDRDTHEILGKTDDQGFVYVEVSKVEKLISIDPNYGEQQTLINYPEDFSYNSILNTDIIIFNWPGGPGGPTELPPFILF